MNSTPCAAPFLLAPFSPITVPKSNSGEVMFSPRGGGQSGAGRAERVGDEHDEDLVDPSRKTRLEELSHHPSLGPESTLME